MGRTARIMRKIDNVFGHVGGNSIMDVMLDTNILERNFKMHSNAFANLFAYLHRTTSKLVLSKLVWDEAHIRYAEKLRARVDSLRTAWDNLGSIQFSSHFAHIWLASTPH